MKQLAITLPDGAHLTGYLHDREEGVFDLPRPAIVVCPGGAYAFCSPREADPVALAFFAKGYQTFVLYYPVAPNASAFRPLIAASRAIVHLRENAGNYHIEPKQVAVCGFSAGGHLALSTGVLWNAPEVRAAVSAPNGENRPAAMILCYPVVTCGEFTHAETRANVTGSEGACALDDTFSLEKHVGADTPPVFLWHTVADESVPVENALLLLTALRKGGVPFESHLFADGEHGMSMCTYEVGSPDAHNARWFMLCCEWLGKLFRFPEY